MADIDAIRRGLAANLAVLKPDTVGQVYPYLLQNPSPPSVMVSGIEAGGIDYISYGDSVSIMFLIEVCLGVVSDIGAQKLLGSLLASSGATSLVTAVQADRRLTSRMGDDGRVTADEGAAADAVAFEGFRGQTPFTLPNRTEVLLATFAVQVLA